MKINNSVNCCRFHLRWFGHEKLDLGQKYIILLSKIAILLLKGLFKRKKIIFYKKIWKIMYLTNFIFNYFFFHIAYYKIFKNGAILINILNIFVYKNFVLKNCFLIVLAIKEFIFKN